jgi:hypothetical protein
MGWRSEQSPSAGSLSASQRDWPLSPHCCLSAVGKLAGGSGEDSRKKVAAASGVTSTRPGRPALGCGSAESA